MATQIHLTNADTASPTAQEEPMVIERLAECPSCGRQAILFSRTIQTFCYRCGQPVSKLDQNGMYYNPLKPISRPISAA